MQTIYTASIAIISAIIAYYLRGLEARRSSHQSRYNDIITEISAIQSCAQRYWAKACGAQSERHFFIESEAELKGRFHSMFAVYSVMTNRLSQLEIELIQKRISALFQAATGGDFGDDQRVADPGRIQRVYSTSGALISALRSSQDYHLLSGFERFFLKFDT